MQLQCKMVNLKILNSDFFLNLHYTYAIQPILKRLYPKNIYIGLMQKKVSDKYNLVCQI